MAIKDRLFSRRVEKVQLPVIPIVGQLAAQNPGTISLGQGVVHYGPPPEVVAAVVGATSDEHLLHRYGDVRGQSRLIELIVQKLSQENGIQVDGSCTVVCTAGSNMGFLNALLAVADVEDEIILLSPYYFNHQMAVEIAGCRPVIVPTTREYQIDLDAIRSAITQRTRAVVTVSPNNPTGAVYARDDLTEVNRLCGDKGIYHISDEAYEYFVYAGAAHFSAGSITGASNHTISLYSFSKSFGMAGWRCGYMVVPEHLLVPIKKIQDTNLICPPIVSQVAAIAALEFGSSWCTRRLEEYNRVRDTMISELADLGDRCHIPTPQGAFYMLLQLQTDKQDMFLVERLIRDYRVACLPGSTFGVTNGCSLRVSYGPLLPATAAEGIGRLKNGLLNLL